MSTLDMRIANLGTGFVRPSTVKTCNTTGDEQVFAGILYHSGDDGRLPLVKK